ncbi:MAG: ribbon-helix-helix protein, CopG family [Acidobacteriota bacterium]
MPQLHLYVPEDLAAEIARRARAQGLSVSRFLNELVQQQVATAWPDDYFDTVVGGWRGKRLARAPQGQLESRDRL